MHDKDRDNAMREEVERESEEWKKKNRRKTDNRTRNRRKNTERRWKGKTEHAKEIEEVGEVKGKGRKKSHESRIERMYHWELRMQSEKKWETQQEKMVYA